MKKYLKAFLFLACISSVAFAQEGKSFGIQFGLDQGGMTGFTGYTSTGINITGGIFKQWMKKNKKNQPSYGLEMQLIYSSYTMGKSVDITQPTSSFSISVYSVPVLFKINLASTHAVLPKDKNDEKKGSYFQFRGIYLFGGPIAGYLTTNASGPGELTPFFGGGMGGIQVWLGNAKFEISAYKSLTKIYKGYDNAVNGVAGSIGFAF